MLVRYNNKNLMLILAALLVGSSIILAIGLQLVYAQDSTTATMRDLVNTTGSPEILLDNPRLPLDLNTEIAELTEASFQLYGKITTKSL
jgi:hypothetical protein